jgi:putative spermidine/putrescine transport system permease protein
MRWSFDPGGFAYRAITFLIIFSLFLPVIILIVVSFNPSGFVLPPSGLTLRWYVKALTYRDFLTGMYVSLVVALISSGTATALGVLISLALIRYRFQGRTLLNTFFMSPLMVPTAIMGLAIYLFFVKLGMSDGVFGLLAGHTILVLPFSIMAISASLRNFDLSLEEAAMNVGAGPLKTFLYVTLPVIRMGILASMIIAFINSWNNFALSIFLTTPNWIPLPMQLYSYIKFEYDPSGAALSSCLIFLSGVVIILIDRLIGLDIVMGIGGEKK